VDGPAKSTTNLGWLKPYESWDVYHRFQLVIPMSSIHSISHENQPLSEPFEPSVGRGSIELRLEKTMILHLAKGCGNFPV